MQRILLPGTNLETSRLGFGTASLHHAVRSKERQALLRAVFDLGITHFDTARMYGEGMAELELGRFLVGQRQHVTIGTKFGFPASELLERFPALLYVHRVAGAIRRRVLASPTSERPRLITPNAAEESLARSLRALRTDWIDILFLHEPQLADLDQVLELAEWLRRQRENGRVRFLGLAGGAECCVAIAHHLAGLFDVLQVEDSLEVREADVVIESGRPLQITYGYLRRASTHPIQSDGCSVIRRALERNRQGVVLVSSRRCERLRAMAELVG